MSYKYKLKFIPTALKEWKKLDGSIQSQFKKKLKERLRLEMNLYTILQILSVTLFEKVQLDQLFANYDYKKLPEFKEQPCNQLNLFEY